MKTYSYKMRPTKEQELRLWKTMHLTRKLYNDALQELIDHYKLHGKHLQNFDHQRLHNSKRHTELPAYVVDETITRLHRAFKTFFRSIKKGSKAGFPRFKAENRWRSFSTSTSNGMSLRGSRFHAGKKLGGKIRVCLPCAPTGKQKMARILHRASGWYLHIICEEVAELPSKPTGKVIGLDVGIKYLVADSDGEVFDNGNLLRKSLGSLRIAQRRMSRRKRGSIGRKKASRMIARIYEKISQQRKDRLHKISRYYVENYDLVVMEDLRIENLAKNSRLAMSIQDASWGMLRRMIAYKAEKAGRTLTLVKPHFTSQKCHRCGEIVQKSLSVRTHICPHCLLIEDRDINAAKNILGLGLSLQALTYRNTDCVA